MRVMLQKFAPRGASIPALGFGTSPLPGGLSPDSVLAALAAGYRHIDAARKYGTEHVVGEAVRASGIPRSEIFITTKVSHENLRPADFARSIEQSLKALQTNYVDLLLVHWPNPEIAPEQYMPALAKAKRDGLARNIGVANFNIALLDRAVALCSEGRWSRCRLSIIRISTSRSCSPRCGGTSSSSSLIARSGAGGCFPIQCSPKSQKRMDAPSRRSHCAGCSSSKSRLSRARRMRNASPRTRTFSISR